METADTEYLYKINDGTSISMVISAFNMSILFKLQTCAGYWKKRAACKYLYLMCPSSA